MNADPNPTNPPDHQVESLSGGERRRLHLAAVLATAPNVLLLDEPTNDLDLSTVEVLEEWLGNYRCERAGGKGAGKEGFNCASRWAECWA